jgi:hypothetical protein
VPAFPQANREFDWKQGGWEQLAFQCGRVTRGMAGFSYLTRFQTFRNADHVENRGAFRAGAGRFKSTRCDESTFPEVQPFERPSRGCGARDCDGVAHSRRRIARIRRIAINRDAPSQIDPLAGRPAFRGLASVPDSTDRHRSLACAAAGACPRTPRFPRPSTSNEKPGRHRPGFSYLSSWLDRTPASRRPPRESRLHADVRPVLRSRLRRSARARRPPAYRPRSARGRPRSGCCSA